MAVTNDLAIINERAGTPIEDDESAEDIFGFTEANDDTEGTEPQAKQTTSKSAGTKKASTAKKS